ncbi:MAG: NAD(+) synthase, partial [Acholeplasmatales bacterium]|nr:NAD(+) synthase [Acholeplasmatales bacterium]
LDIDISSSKIRSDIDQYSNLLNKKVYNYIKENSLYQRRINMFNHDFLKVCAITPRLEVGNPDFNIKEILNTLDNCKASVAVLPELCVTGYTCNDLFFQKELLEESNKAIDYFLHNNTFKGLVILGAPLAINGSLYNVAFVIKENRILGIVPKRSLPNNKEYYEKRFFKSSLNNEMNEVYFNGFKIPFGNIIFRDEKHGLNIGVEICEDMWASVTPSNIMAQYGANVILNLSASNETYGKDKIRRNTVLENSRRNCGAYVYASAGALESTSETVYSGHNIIASLGNLVKETCNFSVDSEIVYGDIDLGEIKFKRRMNTNLHDDFKLNYKAQEVQFELEESKDYEFDEDLDDTPFVPKNDVFEAFEKISQIQEYGLYKRILHTRAKTLVIGVSGGLDSTLALLVACQTFKKLNKNPKDIIAVTMPSFATSDRTHTNANELMKGLGVTVKEIPIENISLSVFDAIEQDKDNHDVTYENTQARIRTLLLMNIANKTNGLVLGTGDMSELALGWCTYNGDQMSMYGINAGVPKTLVRFLTKYYGVYKYKELADILNDIIDTPISPELSNKGQSTEASIGKYEINDYILNRFLSCGDDKERIKFLLKKTFNLTEEDIEKNVSNFFRRFFTQQFKRQALPDGPKVLDISLSPRSDFRMPSDISRH